MPQKESVFTDKAPAPLPFFSQAIKCNGMVYCSGSIGTDPKTGKLVEGSVADRCVSHPPPLALRVPKFPFAPPIFKEKKKSPPRIANPKKKKKKRKRKTEESIS
jgi:hypothetical protein